MAVSFSSIEHAGLGRYGDPLNAYGDLQAVAHIWCLLRPNGHLFLGIPYGNDLIKFNANRVYGPKRLPHLTANFWVVDSTSLGPEARAARAGSLSGFQPTFLLQKLPAP